MGNEMGNSNVTGVEASELDNVEAAKAIMSLDSLKATEKYDAEDVATNEPLKDAIVSNVAEATNMVNQENVEEKHMESIEDDPKQTEEQNQQESSEDSAPEQDAEDLATNESLLDSIISDDTDAANVVNEANLQKESDQAHSFVAEDEPNQQNSSEEKEEEMKSNSALDALSRKEETQPILFVDLENNERAENPRITSAESYNADLKEKTFSDENSPESTKKIDQIGDVMSEEIDESSTANSTSLKGNNIIDSLDGENGSCREEILVDSNVIDRNEIRIEEVELQEEDKVESKHIVFHPGSTSSAESINTVFLDAVDYDLKALLIEEEIKEIDQSPPKIDLDVNGKNLFPKVESAQTKIDGGMVDNNNTQFSTISPGQEEKLDKANGRSEYSIRGQLMQEKDINGIDSCDSATVIESQHVKEEDQQVEGEAYNRSMVDEQKLENKIEELNDEDKHVEDKLSSSISDALVVSSEDGMKGKEDLDAEDVINTTAISNDAADLLEEQNESTRDLISTLLEPERSLDESMTKETKDPNAGGSAAEERSEDPDEVFGGQIKVLDTSMSKEEHVHDLNLVGTVNSASYQSESDDNGKSSIMLQQKSPNHSKELEEQHTEAESTIETSDKSICAGGDINNCLNISSELRAIIDKSNSEADQVLAQENEVSGFENIDANLDFAKQPREYNSISEAAVCIVKAESSTSETIESLFCLEKSSVEIVNSESNSPQKDCEKILLLDPLESANCLIDVSENQEIPASTANIFEVKCEEPDKTLPNHEKTAQDDTFGFLTSIPDTKESTIYDVNTTSILESSKEESDKSPLLSRKNSKERELPSLERNDSRKLKIPLLSLMKEDVFTAESSDEKAGLIPKNNDAEMCLSTPKEIASTSPKRRGKQKPRSSLFGSCMCCTTTAN
ncbi:uncharacterized protein LOC109712470 [Ananas comosus]|uniref:Uncharacterized protein LOC109712470 n=1 Tax=Ananas comosus TaxID=4615 RepID=A0A6P5FDZ1_ANACO|nr:uncharacterized protein LOC109712470 [Ananas comosus]